MTIFLDRDGVINRKCPENDYVKCWEEFEFLPGVLEAIRLLSARADRLVIVTNQRGIARGRMTEQDLADIHARMLAAIRAAGGRIDAIYYCPHEEGVCQCRKPRTGLFERARQDFPDIDYADALALGDSLSDLEPAARLGCTTVLVAAGPRRAKVLGQAFLHNLQIDYGADTLSDFAVRLCSLPDRQALE
jgi:D-glycero-D-manno-heptose 1,7-bisphosphate phosphatase